MKRSDHQILDLEALIQIPYVDPDMGFDISPDGKQVAYSWNKTGQWEIYVVDIDPDSEPKQISTGPGAKFGPKWRPDGKQIGYVCDLDGGECYDLHVHDLQSGDYHNLTAEISDSLSPSFAWSPDSTKIAFSYLHEGHFDTFILNISSDEIKQVLDERYHDFVIEWSPDGRYLAVEAEGPIQDYWTYIVPLDGLESFPLSIDDQPICAKSPVWSPDSRSLAFASNVSGQFEIGVYDVDKGEIRWITSGKGEKEYPDWSPDGSQLVFVLNHGPNTYLALKSSRNSELSEPDVHCAQIEPGVIYTPAFTPNGNEIVFVFDNPRHPDDLWAFNLKSGEFRQLTKSLPETYHPELFVMPEEITYPGLDGELVPALLYRITKDDTLPPGVLNIHGGPNWLSQITWDPLTQHMANRGWVVLAPNYRGSTGYGKEWQLASRFDFGGVDTDDVVAGADYLVNEGIADPERVAVTGRSWGGYLTMTCLTRYPDRWAVGAAIVPSLNWFTAHENSREDLQHWDIENFGDPKENYDLWYSRSPFFFLDRITAPVQLICGENDVRCPASESKQAYETLRKLDKECEYHLYLDEGHFFLKIENQIKSKVQTADFLARFLE